MSEDDRAPESPEFLKPYLAQIQTKILPGWVDKPTRKGGGWRWVDPENTNNQVRIDPGHAEVSQPSQQVDHVVINYNGRIIGRDGIAIVGTIEEAWEAAHIPLTQWLTWSTWYAP